MAQSHHTTFEANRTTKRFRAICTCGWAHHADTLEECQTRAATHDVDWQPVGEAPAEGTTA